MTWAKLSDGLYDDPHMESMSLAAIGTFALVLSYCGKHETDGHITRARVETLARGKRAIVSELLTANVSGEPVMVENGNAGLVVRNWAKFNPTKAELDERRKTWRENKKRGRKP